MSQRKGGECIFCTFFAMAFQAQEVAQDFLVSPIVNVRDQRRRDA
jgi:hypothetical protein